MPKQPTMIIPDLQDFSASTLADSAGLATALTKLESCLAGPDLHLDLIVQDLCSVPSLFEFVISALPSAKGLVSMILDAYPTNPALVKGSSADALLRRLSSVLFALPPYLFSTDTIRRIGRYKIYVEDALPALTLLSSSEFSSYITTSLTQTSPKHRHANTAPSIDMAPLHKLKAKIPVDNADAVRMAQDINHNLKTILKFCLELLLEPFLAQQLKQAYISADSEDDSTVHPSALQETEDAEAIESKPPAYPKVQPMKAALYFENAQGFGEWRIVIGTDAMKKLRELANGDKKKCAIVLKKIRQLSNGHFSIENQKRLNSFSGIPIFEAKMQQDLRLVYQVDIAPDFDGEVEQQVIKIYGIYTLTQMNRIWDAMGQRLAGKGKEYRRRCTFRTPVNAGGDVYAPACFPSESTQNDTRTTSLVLSGEVDVVEELHSLLVLEKYVTFSQAFLHSLIANQDVQHVFELAPQERRIVACKTSCYVQGRSGTGKTTTMLFKILGIQRAWETQTQTSDMPKPRQVFVTKSRVLATKVQEYFTKLLESLALAGYSLEDLKRMRGRSTELGLVDIDDVDQVDVPQNYSALEDNHFPLFVTFDKLARMIAADIFSGDDPEAKRFAKFFVNPDEVQAQDSFVTYDIFARTYWPCFPQPSTKGLEPWLVFSEIIGIIKGSEKSLSCPEGFLDAETYCDLSARSYPTFANQRETLYAIFERYCKLKKERRHYDVADRTQAILRAFLGGIPLKGQRVDFLYIDEAQDNLLIDALLLRLICRNPEGLFWAGDTAQTISAGSSFRFNDLKAFLYRIEQDQSMHLIQDRSVSTPTPFQLAINYRSHGGIVNCAHTVIERITQFWPDAIDNLQPEHGIVDGFKPVFFRGWDQDTVRHERFLFGESGSRIEFGAQQCILVRDDKAIEKLRKEVGEIGLVMTLYDSKGLEFNDVLLYNFFEDSTVDALRWRVLLNNTEGEVDGQNLATIYAPSFDCRSAGVCSELKLLYVGITRARKNLWIFDKSEKSEPMRMIWTSRDQVQSCTPGTDAPRLAVSSTPAEWESFGHDLFKHKKYPQAMHCFARALQPRMVAICEAFRLREVARAKVGVAPLRVQEDAFFTAANAFVVSGNDAPPGKDKSQYYHNAAECYVRAGDDRKAADAYLDAQEHDLAARRYRKAGLFDKTLDVLHHYCEKISSESSEELRTVCRLYYCSKRDAIRPRLPLFSSFEEERKFLEDYGLDVARASLLENHGRYVEAAELHLSENRPLEAIRNLLNEKGSADAIQKATQIVLDGLWRRCSFGIISEKVAVDQHITALLNLANELPSDFLDPLDQNEISMFRAIVQADSPSLEKLSLAFTEARRNAAAVLALDHFFRHLPELKSYTLTQMALFLDRFRLYARLLHDIISHPNPLGSTSIKRLFSITEISITDYSVEPGSFLYCSATGGRQAHLQPSIVALSKTEMTTALRKHLAAHLRERVTEENEACCHAVVFSQCLTFIVAGQCKRVDCPQEHVNSTDLDYKRYNFRIGIHLQQICILQSMYSVNPHFLRRDCVLDWLTHLYEAFNSHSHVQGSTADLDLSIIPGAREGIAIMKYWVRDALYGLQAHHNPSGFLTTVLKLTSLIFAFDGPSALKCIKQAPFNASCARVPAFVYPGGCYVLEDIVRLFDGTQYTCISAGLLLLRHVLKSSLFVDLSVFCDCLEEVVGKICISWRLSLRPPLDGLVLPRGWLSSNKDFVYEKEIKIDLTVDLLNYVRDLLVFLQSDGANRTYFLSYTELTPTLCSVFTARICRALCLLTYNVKGAYIRNKVKSIFGALPIAGNTYKFYRKYVEARDDEYLKVMIDYDVEAKVVIQGLVQLLHKQRDPKRVPLLSLPRIQHINFADPSEVPSLLTPQLVARSGPRPHAQVLTPCVPHTSQTEKIEGEEKVQPEKPKGDLVEEVHEELQDLAPAPNGPVLSCGHEPTEEEISAAAKIQATYRAYRKHREAQARAMGMGLKAQRNTVFIACLKNVYARCWERSPYRTIYLWALPRLVVCLDQAISVANAFKNKTKGQFSKGAHQHLEVIGKQMNMINTLLEDGGSLREVIEPNAVMHKAKDKDAMRKAVSDVEAFIHRLPGPTLCQEIQDEFQVAYKLVVVGKRPVSKPEKPTLNTEDV